MELFQKRLPNQTCPNLQTIPVAFEDMWEPLVFDEKNPQGWLSVEITEPDGMHPVVTRNSRLWLDVVLESSRTEDGLGPWSNRLKITPKIAGEYHIVLFLKKKIRGDVFKCVFDLTVNPDPKSLWKQLPVAEGTPFSKPLSDTYAFEDEHASIVAASLRGRSHAHIGTNRDDDMAFWHDTETGRYVLAVADGAGSSKFSRKGSLVAVQSAVAELSAAFTEDVWTEILKKDSLKADGGRLLATAAIHAAHKLRETVDEVNADPCWKEPAALKDFSTTLLLAVLKIDSEGTLYGVTLSVGDGAIAWYAPNASELLCVPDSGEFSGQTRFLTTPGVWPRDGNWSRFVEDRAFAFKKPVGSLGMLMLMTDGVSDPFFETEELLKNPDNWDTLSGEISASGALCSETTVEERSKTLCEWLNFWSVGNHDDRTIALFQMKGAC